jgi:hypothetical protein
MMKMAGTAKRRMGMPTFLLQPGCIYKRDKESGLGRAAKIAKARKAYSWLLQTGCNRLAAFFYTYRAPPSTPAGANGAAME